MRPLVGYACLLSFPLLPACADSSDGLSESEFRSAYVEAFCAKRGACCSAKGEANDDKACRDSAYLLSIQRTPVAAGGVYDADEAAKCVAAVEAWTAACSGGWPPEEPCLRVYRGAVPPGGACSTAGECELPPSGLSSASCSGGRCFLSSVGLAGAACGDPLLPFVSVTCDEDSGLQCLGGKCVPLAALGAECPSAGRCAVGLRCDGGKCVEGLSVGAKCPGAATCAEGAYCADDSVCHPLRQKGESCFAEPAHDQPCAPGLRCPTLGDTGGSCIVDGPPSELSCF